MSHDSLAKDLGDQIVFVEDGGEMAALRLGVDAEPSPGLAARQGRPASCSRAG